MSFDLDNIAADLPEWSFPIVVRGVSYQTRPMTGADLDFMGDMEAGRVQNSEQIMKWIVGLFPENKPDLGQFTIEALGLMVQAIAAHSRDRMRQITPGNAAGSGRRMRELMEDER